TTPLATVARKTMALSNESPAAPSAVADGDAHATPLPLPQPPTGDRGFHAQTTSWQDRLLVVLLAGLAFMLASFPAPNRDLWLHLAHGRAVVQNPSVVAGDVAVATSWLYDILTYGLFEVAGGVGLVLAKAVLVVVLALVLLQLSRTGPGWIVPVACTALAL